MEFDHSSGCISVQCISVSTLSLDFMVSEVLEALLFLIHNQRVQKTTEWKLEETLMGTDEVDVIPCSNHISMMMESIPSSIKTMTH